VKSKNNKINGNSSKNNTYNNKSKKNKKKETITHNKQNTINNNITNNINVSTCTDKKDEKYSFCNLCEKLQVAKKLYES